MSCSILKKFIINSSSSEVKTVPFDCGAKLIKNEKLLNYVNYFRAVTEIGTKTNFLKQIALNRNLKKNDTTIINLKMDGVNVRWDKTLSAFILKFSDVDSLISSLNKNILNPLCYGKKYPWVNSVIKYTIANESEEVSYDILSAPEANALSNTSINKFITTKAPDELLCYETLIELNQNLIIFKKLLKINYVGFNKAQLKLKNEKLYTYINFIEKILYKVKYISLGRYKTNENPITKKSFPFYLPAILNLTMVDDLKFIIKPNDIIRVSNYNLFNNSSSKINDLDYFKYSNDEILSISYDKYTELFENGRFSKELIFQQEKLVNTKLWDFLIDFYITNINNFGGYQETNNLLFFDPEKDALDMLEGYNILFNSIKDYDQKERIADRSVLFHLLSDEVKRIDNTFESEYEICNNINKTNTVYKGVILSKNLSLDEYQRNFIFKSLNYLDEKVSPNTYPLVLLNAPTTTNKSNVVSSFIASSVVENCYNNFEPNNVFAFQQNNKFSENSFENIKTYHNDVSTKLSARLLDGIVQDRNFDSKIPYFYNLSDGLSLIESYINILIKNYDQAINKFVINYEKIVNVDLLDSSTITVLNAFRECEILSEEIDILKNNVVLSGSDKINSISNDILRAFKEIYEFFIRVESAKRTYLFNFNKMLDIISEVNTIDVGSIHPPEFENIIKSRVKSLTDDTETIAEEIYDVQTKISKENEDIEKYRKTAKDLKIEIDKCYKSVKSDLYEILNELIQIEQQSGLLLTVKGGKNKLRKKLFSKYNSTSNSKYYISLLNQYVMVEESEVKTSRRFEGEIENILNLVKNDSKFSAECNSIEKKISNKQQKISELNAQHYFLESKLKELNETRDVAVKELDNHIREQKISELLIKSETYKRDISNLCLSLSGKVKKVNPDVSTKLNECIDLLYKTNNFKKMKFKFETALNTLLDNTIKVTLYSLASRWNESKFLEEVVLYPKGNTAEVVTKKFSILSRIFHLFLSTPESVINSIKSISDEGERVTYGVIDTLIIDEANSFVNNYGIIGLAVAKKAIIIGDEYRKSPEYIISRVSDELLSKKILDTGYFITPSISDNIFNCHNSSILKVANHFSPWATLNSINRGDFLMHSSGTCVEILNFLDINYYNSQLNFEFSPIYVKNSHLKYRDVLPDNIDDKLSYEYVTNKKINLNKSADYFKPLILNIADTSFDSLTKTNNKEIIQILSWLDMNFDKIINIYGDELHKIIAIVTPFKSQSLKIIKAGKKLNFKNAKLNNLKDFIFNPYDDKSIFVGDMSEALNIKVPIILFSNCYDDTFNYETSYFIDNANIINQSLASAQNTFVFFTNQKFISKIEEDSKYPSGLISYIKGFI